VAGLHSRKAQGTQGATETTQGARRNETTGTTLGDRECHLRGLWCYRRVDVVCYVGCDVLCSRETSFLGIDGMKGVRVMSIIHYLIISLSNKKRFPYTNTHFTLHITYFPSCLRHLRLQCRHLRLQTQCRQVRYNRRRLLQGSVCMSRPSSLV